MIQNPSSLYSGGVVELNSNPYLQIALREKAKKQALYDTLYKHYSELPTKLNTAGVRQQDLNDLSGHGGGSINSMIERRKQYWDENKDKIMKGGQEKQILDQFDQNILSAVDDSKSKGKFQLDVGKAFFEGGRDFDENDLSIKDAINQSIFDKKHYKNPDIRQPYGYEDFSTSAAPYNSSKQQQFDKAVLGNVKPSPVLDDNGQKLYTLDAQGLKVMYNKSYKPEDIYNAANKAAEITSGDRTMQKQYRRLLEQEDKVKEASAALSKLAGVEVIVDTPEQMAAGLKASQLEKYTEAAEETDVKGANAFKKKLQDDRLAAQFKRLKYSEAHKDKRTQALINGIEVDDVLEKAANKSIAFNVELPIVGEINKLLPDGRKIKSVIPLSMVDGVELEDILGKKDEHNNTPIKPIININTNQKFILQGEDGKFYGDNMQEISRDRVLNATYNRTKNELKATYKKEITNPSANTNTKNSTGSGKKKYNPKTGKFE